MLKLFGLGKPDHPLADPREAKRILDALPEDDPYKALEELVHWLGSVSAAEGFRPQDRIQLLLQVDDAAQPLLRRLARDYSGATRPSRFTENRIWSTVHGTWKAAGLAYARTIDLFVQNAKGADAARAQLPLVLCRALRSLGQQMRWAYLRYGPVDASVWGVVHNIVSFAEARGAVTVACTPYPGGAETTAQCEYLKVAVFSASSPDSLLPAEVELAERLITEQVARFTLSTQGEAEAAFWVDLAQPMAPQRLVRRPPQTPGVRYLGASAPRAEIEARAARTRAAGRAPAELLQGTSMDTEAVLGVLEHLATNWSSAPPERRSRRHPVKSRLSVVHGLEAVINALGGSSADLLDFGASAAESWIVENVSTEGFGALVPQLKGDWLKVGVLLGLQPAGGSNWVIGLVRRVSRSAGPEVRIGIQTIGRAPEAAAFDIVGAGSVSEPGVMPGNADPKSGEVLILLKPGVFAPGQNLERRGADGRHHLYLPQSLVERGADFEIGRFREMVREG